MIPVFTRLGGSSILVAFAMASSVSPAPAAGSPYPYCYIDYDGLRSCGFRTLQDCYRIRVGTGMCVSNPYFAPRAR